MAINKKLLKEVYPEKKDMEKLISNTQRDIMDAEQYNTMESKQKVKRLKKFLEEIK